MKMINQFFVRYFPILLLSVFLPSCASIPQLKVHYQLPPLSNELKGKKVVLALEDAREKREILGQGAKEEFENFTKNVIFSVARNQEQGFRIGVLQVPAMVREGFKRRLENSGMEVLLEDSSGEPKLLIVLKAFVLDLENRNWVAKAGYEARLEKDGKVLSMQTIDVQAEQYKFWGRSGADAVMGEVFTDMVNRLNVFRLFQQANLVDHF